MAAPLALSERAHAPPVRCITRAPLLASEICIDRAEAMAANGGKAPSKAEAMWAALNAGKPKAPANFERLFHGFSSDLPEAVAAAAVARAGGGGLAANPLAARLTGAQAPPKAPAAARGELALSAATLARAEPAPSMERSVQALQSAEPAARRAALANLRAAANDATHPHRAEFELSLIHI